MRAGGLLRAEGELVALGVAAELRAGLVEHDVEAAPPQAYAEMESHVGEPDRQTLFDPLFCAFNLQNLMEYYVILRIRDYKSATKR